MIGYAGCDVIRGQSKRIQLFTRQVQATRFPILTNVAQDIGQLQGDAELDRVGDSLLS